MAQPLDVKHLLATGKQFSDSGRSQARQLGNDLVSQGRQATEQIAARIDDLAGRASRERIEELRQTLRDDVQPELRMLREVLTGDLAHVEGAVDRIGATVSEARSERREREEELRASLREEVQAELRMLREVLTGDLARVEGAVDRIGAAVSEARSERREHEEELRASLREEVQRQLSLLGLVTREDVVALGRSLREDLAESLTNPSEPDARPEAPMQVTPPHQQPPTT